MSRQPTLMKGELLNNLAGLSLPNNGSLKINRNALKVTFTLNGVMAKSLKSLHKSAMRTTMTCLKLQ